MRIRPVLPEEYPVYDDLARSYGSLFNRLDWLDIFKQQMKILGLFDNGDNLVGGVSIYQERRWGLKIIRRAPFTPTCGPFLIVRARNPVAVLEERRKALECMIAYLKLENPAVCMLPLDPHISDTLPFFWNVFKVIPNFSFKLDLSYPYSKIEANMSAKCRGHILKARKDGLVVEKLSDYAIVRELVLKTFGRQEKYIHKTVLDAILYQYARPGNSFAFAVFRDDVPIAATFLVHDAKIAYLLLAGYDDANKHHGAGALCVSEAIKHAGAIGLKTFDFEGSVIPQIETYFRSFGGQLVPYFTINKAWLPIEMGLKLIKRNIF
jgi:hypothetical protein